MENNNQALTPEQAKENWLKKRKAAQTRNQQLNVYNSMRHRLQGSDPLMTVVNQVAETHGEKGLIELQQLISSYLYMARSAGQ